MHLSHRTGALTWVTTRSSQSRRSATSAPSRLDSSVSAGSATATRRPPAQRVHRRRHVPGVERAGHRQRPQPGPGGRIGGERGELVQRSGRHDLPGAVDVRRGQAVRLDGGEHLCLVAAEHRGHPGRLGPRPGPWPGRAPGPAASRPRREIPAKTPAASSPTLCPAAAPVGTGPGSARRTAPRAAARAAATSSGWATAVSLISSALGRRPAPDQVAAGQRGPGAESLGETGELQPRGRGSPVSERPGRAPQ